MRSTQTQHEKSESTRDNCLTILDDGLIALRHMSATDIVRADRVVSVHSAGNNALIVTDAGPHTVHASLRTTIGALERFGLIRIHRGVAINIARVRRLESRGRHRLRIILDTGAEMEVGRTFQAKIRDRFGARTHR